MALIARHLRDVRDLQAQLSKRARIGRAVSLRKLARHAPYSLDQVFRHHRLDQIVLHAQPYRALGVAKILVTGDDHHAAVRQQPRGLFAQPQSVVHRHPNVRDQDVRLSPERDVEARVPIPGFAHHGHAIG